VPEFIDFFTSSPSTRVARAAASAVRVSLNMLQLEVAAVAVDVKAKENSREVKFFLFNFTLLSSPPWCNRVLSLCLSFRRRWRWCGTRPLA
jgi:hypothetical protein